MSESLRPVIAIKAPDVTPSALGEPPSLVWVSLDQLVINDAYQRHISERSVTLIRRMVARFDWGRVKALSVVDIGGGKYEVIDGQHTAIAAATHGRIEALPCLLTRGKDQNERAADFVSLNRDRLTMTPLQVFFAELAAGDEIATDVVQGATAGGGKVLRYPPPFARYQVGDLLCLGELRKLAAEGGPAYVKRAVSVCIAARCAPIKAMTLKVVAALIWGGGPPIQDELIADVIRVHGQDELVSRARAMMMDRGGRVQDLMARLIRELAEEA